jgi:hypothetical protein
MVQSVAIAYALVSLFFAAMALVERQRKGTLGLGIRAGFAALFWPISFLAVVVHVSIELAAKHADVGHRA